MSTVKVKAMKAHNFSPDGIHSHPVKEGEVYNAPEHIVEGLKRDRLAHPENEPAPPPLTKEEQANMAKTSTPLITGTQQKQRSPLDANQLHHGDFADIDDEDEGFTQDQERNDKEAHEKDKKTIDESVKPSGKSEPKKSKV